MRKTMSGLAVITALLGAGVSSTRAQVPVIDGASLAQLITQVQQQLQQLQAAQQQLTQVTTLVTGATGGRGMDAIAGALNQQSVRELLPPNFADLAAQTGSAITAFGSIASTAQSIRSTGQIVTYPGATWNAQEMARRGDRHAIELAAAKQIFNTATTRRSSLDTLRQQLSTTADQASALQLGVRINSEVSQGINDLNASMALLLQQRANDGVDQQRREEAGSLLIQDLEQRLQQKDWSQ
jgi:hypothetical protein